MTELKIESKQPSIQNLQLKPEPNASLTQDDIVRLFKGSARPKFDLMEIKQQNFLSKRQKAQFFISILEQWNRKIEESQFYSTNARTEFLMVEFIYSSMKRISLMADYEVDKQLAMLYSWFLRQAKNSSGFTLASMPARKCQNEYYNVTKTFKTNPTIIIKEYIRPKCLLGSTTKLGIDPTEEQSEILRAQLKMKPSKQTLNGNFITSCQQKKVKSVFQFNKREDSGSKYLLDKYESKTRNQELRNYLQKKEIELKEWSFKLKKGRLLSESTKNYLNGNFHSIQRPIKTSQCGRDQKSEVFESVKKMRIQTSFGRRVLHLSNQNVNPTIPEISHFGLMSNPFEVKIKKKKTKGKGKK